MHTESAIVAVILGIGSLALITRKNQGARAVGIVLASLAGLMVVAGLGG